MLNRLIRRSNNSLPTNASSSHARHRLGYRKPSCISIQAVSFSGEDRTGLRPTRYYGQKLERTHSEHISRSKKAATTYFNRQSGLPHWMNSNWGLRTRKPVDVAKHPSLYLDYREDRWRTKNRSKGMSDHHGDQGEASGNGSLVARFWDYWEDCRRTIEARFWEKRANRRRTKNRSKGMPSYHGDQREAPGHESLLLSPNNTLTFPTVAETIEQEQAAEARQLASTPPQSNARSRRIRPIAPMNGRLRKGEATYERDLITTIGSFFSRATSRVMGRIRSRKLNSEGEPIRGKLKKVSSRFSIEADSGTDNSTLVIETPPTHSHVVVPPPGLLADSLHSRSHPSWTPRRKRLKKRSGVSTSPTSSLPFISPNPLKEESDSSQPDYRYMASPTGSLAPLRPPPLSPVPLSPNNTPSNSPSTHALTQHRTELVVDIPDPIDWSGLDDVGSEPRSPSESSFTSGGSTFCDKSQTGSLASVRGYTRSDQRALATRQGSTHARLSGTTAASVESECMSSPNSITIEKMSLKKTDFPHFSLTPRGPDAPQQPHPEFRTPEWWKAYEEGLKDRYSKDSANNDPYVKNSQFAHSGLDDATQTGWIGVTA